MDFSRPKTARFWLRLQIKLIRWIGVAVRATLYRRPRHAQVLYSRTSPPFRCLVFRPSPQNAKHADKVYVDFHGGAFIGGTPDEDAEFCTHIANKVGCVVVSGQYRFAPEHPYPTSLNDCHAVTEWAREEFRAKRLALGGFSAGGTLVLGVAQLLARSGRPAAALASFYPPVDFSPRSKSEFPEKNPWIRNMFHEVYLLNVPNDGLADPLLSPFYASPKELPASSMLFIPESDPNKPDMFELVDRINKEKPNTIRGIFMEKVFHGWNLLPEWIIGKQPTAKKWEVYDMVAEEVQRAFEK